MSAIERMLHRPHAVLAFILVTILLGAMGYLRMPFNLFPDTNRPMVSVVTQWPGATADDVALEVTHPVEVRLSALGGVRRITSTSRDQVYRLGMTTDLTEQDVIMGRGEKRLFHGIKQAIDQHAPAAVFVYNTCVPALIGDDLEAVCKAAAQKWGGAGGTGGRGGFLRHQESGQSLGRGGHDPIRGVGTRETDPLPPGTERPGIRVHDVNLIGE